MDETLFGYFKEIDDSLSRLGKSNSSIEYADHIRQEFDRVIENLNIIKSYLGGVEMLQRTDSYFE